MAKKKRKSKNPSPKPKGSNNVNEGLKRYNSIRKALSEYFKANGKKANSKKLSSLWKQIKVDYSKSPTKQIIDNLDVVIKAIENKKRKKLPTPLHYIDYWFYISETLHKKKWRKYFRQDDIIHLDLTVIGLGFKTITYKDLPLEWTKISKDIRRYLGSDDSPPPYWFLSDEQIGENTWELIDERESTKQRRASESAERQQSEQEKFEESQKAEQKAQKEAQKAKEEVEKARQEAEKAKEEAEKAKAKADEIKIKKIKEENELNKSKIKLEKEKQITNKTELDKINAQLQLIKELKKLGFSKKEIKEQLKK